VPKEIVAALRLAFDGTMTDPDYLKLSQQMGNVLNPMSGAALTELNARTLQTPKKIIERYQAAVSKTQ
jgi:hypothetical protein